MYVCSTCSETGNAPEITRHLSFTRHKLAKTGDEVIECEECGDNNIHQLMLLRYGLSDMALLCNQCCSKAEKSSTLYMLTNGSLFQKLPQYFKLRDMECRYCGSDSNLYVGNPKDEPQFIVCRGCLSRITDEKQRSSLVSEQDDHFLTALLGIVEHVPSNNKRRSRKVGRKGGRAAGGRPRKPKPVLADAEERKAHYENKMATAKAFKAGTTVKAVGSNELSAASSRTHSRSGTPGPPRAGNEHKNKSTKGSSSSRPVKSSDNGHKGSKTQPKKTQMTQKSNPKPSRTKAPTKSVNDTPLKTNGPKTTFTKAANGKSDAHKPPKAPTSTKKMDKPPRSNDETKTLTRSSTKNNQNTRDSKAKPSKTQPILKPKGTERRKDDVPNKKKTAKPTDEPAEPQKDDKPKEEPIKLPPGIKKYTPSAEPPLSYSSLDNYFREISYLLFMEEKMSMASSNMSFLEPQDMSLEWYQDQDKKHKQFKVTVSLTEEILNKFLSKKMQQLKKTPFGLNLAIILMLGDEIAWYAQVVTSDTVSAKRGRRGGLSNLEMIAQLYDWNDMPLPLSMNVKNLRILPVSVPVSRVFLAMSRIDNPKFKLMLLGNEPIKQIVFKNYLNFKNRVNESQKVAVQSVLNNAITVLQGPPGTGKTSTIYEIILQLIENLNTFPILVVAASNIAIDNIAEKLLHNHGREILRIVSNEKEKEYSRDHPLASICLHHKVYDALPQQMKQTVDDLRRPGVSNISQNQYKKLLTQQINLSDTFTAQAKVIFTTTVVAGGNQLKLVKKLPVVIMDEATQSSEPTTLIPLSMPGVDKFVFVGDQRQLSSFLMVPNLSLSLFERVLLNNTYRNPHMLDTQYRMHPGISEFPRLKFYNGLLKDGITASDRAMANIPENPVYFWDTKGKAKESRVRIGFREDRGYTYSNVKEIDYITKVLMKLIYDKQVPKSDIGVITPYRGQRDYISNQLVKNELINPEKEEVQVEVDRDDIYNDSKPVTVHLVSGIMIASIDAFQGREKNFLVMSCVRSNDDKKIGFLNDKRRLNVALTRAKYGLILVGDIATLKSDELWKEYLEFLEEKGSVFSSDDFLY